MTATKPMALDDATDTRNGASDVTGVCGNDDDPPLRSVIRNGPEIRCIDCHQVIRGCVARSADGDRCKGCYDNRLRRLAERYGATPERVALIDLLRVDTTCGACARPLIGSQYCSTECERVVESARHEAALARRRVTRYPRLCERCRVAFIPARSDARYCSNPLAIARTFADKPPIGRARARRRHRDPNPRPDPRKRS